LTGLGGATLGAGLGVPDPLALPAVIGFTDFAALVVTLADFIKYLFYF
jgi:hypothetical protein